MAIEFFNFGVNAVNETSSKLQKAANNELQKETDAMFERLHEDYQKKEETQNNEYTPYEDDNIEKKNQNRYNPDDYERVGFSGAFGSKNQALYFAQYMKDKGIDDVVVSPVKLNGEYIVEMPKQFTVREKVKSDTQSHITQLNHEEQDFLRKQLENVAAQEEAKKPKSVDNSPTEEQYDAYTDIQKDVSSPIEQTHVEKNEPESMPHSSSDNYSDYQQKYGQNGYSADEMSSQNADSHVNNSFIDSNDYNTVNHNNSDNNVSDNMLSRNKSSETQPDLVIHPSGVKQNISETKQDIPVVDSQPQSDYNSDDYSKSYQSNDEYSALKHNKTEDYVSKGFNTQQILPEQRSQEKEIKSNPFSSETVSTPTASPAAQHFDNQEKVTPKNIVSYTDSYFESQTETQLQERTEEQIETQAKSYVNSQQSTSYSPYAEFLGNHDNKEVIERIAQTGIIENDSDREILQKFVALSGSSFETQNNQDVNLTHGKEPQLASVRFNNNEKNFIRDSMQFFNGENKENNEKINKETPTAFQSGMADYLSTHKEVADTMSKLAEKGKITTPQERQAFLDYQNAAQEILKKNTDAPEKAKIESQSISIKSKAEFIRTENVTVSLQEKMKANESLKTNSNKSEYKNVTKTSQQMITEFQQQFNIDVQSASLRGRSQRTEKLEELRKEREQENSEFKALTTEGKNLVNFTARNLGLFGSTILNADRIMTDLAQYDVNRANDTMFNQAAERHESLKVTGKSGNVPKEQSKLVKAKVINGNTVVINGKIVTDERVKSAVLAQHAKRVEKAREILKKDADAKEKVKTKQERYNKEFDAEREKYFAEHQDEFVAFKKSEEKRKAAFEKKENERYNNFIKSRKNPDEFIRREYQARGFYKKKPKEAKLNYSSRQEKLIENAKTIQNNLYIQEYAAPVSVVQNLRDGGVLDEVVNTVNEGTLLLSSAVSIAVVKPELDFIKKYKDTFTKDQLQTLDKVLKGQGVSVFNQKKTLAEWSKNIEKAVKNGKIKLSEEEKEIFDSLQKRVKLSDSEKIIAQKYDKFVKDIKKDLNIDFIGKTISRADVLKINEAFLKKAEERGFQFVTATGKFDLKALKELNAKQLKELGISESTRNLLLKTNDPNAWGNLQKGAMMGITYKGLGYANKLAGNDEDMRAMISGTRKTINYAGQAKSGVTNTVKAIKKHQDAMKAKFATVKKNINPNSAKPVKTPKKKASATKAAQPNAKRNERFLKKQAKKEAKVARAENSVFGKAKKKINDTKARVMNTKLGKAVGNVKKAASKAIMILAKYAVAGAAAASTLLMMFIVIVTVIESFTNFFGAKTYKDTVCYKLYESLNDQEQSWTKTIIDYDNLWNEKADVTYGTKDMSYSEYLATFENLIQDGSNIDINPFHQKGVVSSSQNSDYLTVITKYNGSQELRITANANLYGKKDANADENTYYSSTESGHTSNIKDIISMLDVMYQFEAEENSDEAIDALGMTPAQLDWENFKARFKGFFKMVATNVSTFFSNLFGGKTNEESQYISWDDASGNVFSYKTLQNYTATLFSASHQQTWDYTVEYCKKLGYPTVSVNGTSHELTSLSDSDAAELGYCQNPETNKFNIGLPATGADPQPYLEANGTRYYLNKSGTFDITVSTEKNLKKETKSDLCLWSDMSKNSKTFEKIKSWLSKSGHDCWTSSGDNPTGEKKYVNQSSSSWADTISGAKKNMENDLYEKKNKVSIPADKYEWTTESDKRTPTSISKIHAVRSTTAPDLGETEERIVSNGTKSENRQVYFNTSWNSGSQWIVEYLDSNNNSTGIYLIQDSQGNLSLPSQYNASASMVADNVNHEWENEDGSLFSSGTNPEVKKANKINTNEPVYIHEVGSGTTKLTFYSTSFAGYTINNEIKGFYFIDGNGINIADGTYGGYYLNPTICDVIYYAIKNKTSIKNNKNLSDVLDKMFNVNWDLSQMESEELVIFRQSGAKAYNYFTENISERAYTKSTNITQYKRQYRQINGSIEVYEIYKETLTRNCDGHKYTYCGGHLAVTARGNVFSMTNEQLALAGTYNYDYQSPVKMDWSDDRYNEIKGKVISENVDYGDIGSASGSGGCEVPKKDVQGSLTGHIYGLNLYVKGGEWENGFHVVGESDDEVNKQYLCRDIFDIDEMVLKGSGCFGTKDWEDYEGWNGDNMTLAVLRQTMDWQDVYEFDIPSELGTTVLCDEDINKIVDALKNTYGSKLTEAREEAVRIALGMVGREHYNDDGNGTVHSHGLTQELCKAADSDFSANCTAGTSWDFIRLFSSWTGQTATSKSLINNDDAVKNPSPTSYLPADIIRHVRSGTYDVVNDKFVDITDDDVDLINKSKSNESLLLMKKDLAVVYIGELNEDLELSNGRVLKAGQTLCVDLSENKDIGTIYLRSSDATSLCNIGNTKSYYYLKHPDNATYRYIFNGTQYKEFVASREKSK